MLANAASHTETRPAPDCSELVRDNESLHLSNPSPDAGMMLAVIRLIRHHLQHLQPLIESLAWTTKVLFSDPDSRRSLHPNAVLHQQHNKRWWIQRFIRYSEKCTGCCSPTFGSTSIIGDQQAGRGGAGGAMSQREGIIWRMIHAVLAPSGDTGDCSNKIILINSGVVRRPCVQQIETRVRLRILDPFISAPAAHCWLITGPARDNGSNIPVSSLPRVRLQSSHRRARAEQCK